MLRPFTHCHLSERPWFVESDAFWSCLLRAGKGKIPGCNFSAEENIIGSWARLRHACWLSPLAPLGCLPPAPSVPLQRQDLLGRFLNVPGCMLVSELFQSWDCVWLKSITQQLPGSLVHNMGLRNVCGIYLTGWVKITGLSECLRILWEFCLITWLSSPMNDDRFLPLAGSSGWLLQPERFSFSSCNPWVD